MSDQHVEVAPDEPSNAQIRWQPTVGSETIRLLDASDLDDQGQAMVSMESVGVLARCADPQTAESRTGLVVGYVQSGKTLSFTTVISLARDNGIPLIVLLAGTKQNLHQQTSQRLSKDLAVERAGGLSPWALLENPTDSDAGLVADNVKSMTTPGTPEMFRRATVITVMKNPARLSKVGQLLQKLGQFGVDLDEIPVLIVDDEADQAGLNATASDPTKPDTPTYQAIVDLRSVAPRHTYLMYTATPQATLLINIADVLSPDFTKVLTPGKGYTGGEYFFVDHKARFVRPLIGQELTTALAGGDDPPESLKLALATYYLVVSRRGNGPVSMLVHPSHTKDLHDVYKKYIDNMSSNWKLLLDTPGPDRDELVAKYFAKAYENLLSGGADMGALDSLLSLAPYWIGTTQVLVVNSEEQASKKIKWNSYPSWILIGGNKLDRGFTVEGLATTYMPRQLGAGQMDSVQQRARFFGYKSSYANLCRAWLSDATARAFEHYVKHEKLLRKELIEVDNGGLSLKEWKRLMLLDPKYKPTRKAIVNLPYLHYRIRGDSWMSVSRVPDKRLAPGKVGPIEKLWADNEGGAVVDDRDKRATAAKHKRVLVPMGDLIQAVADWTGDDDLDGTVHPEDVSLLNQLSLLLRAKLDDDPSLKVDLFLIDDGGVRSRTPNITGSLDLPQGRDINDPKTFPGDDKFFTDGLTSVQIHRVKVNDANGGHVLGLRVRVPKELSGGVLVEV